MSADTTQLLSQLGYAKHRGCTHGAVAKAIKSGRLVKALVTKDGKVAIDPVIADREWSANSNPAMQRTPAAAKPAAAPAPEKESKPTPQRTATASAAAEATEQVNLAEARAIKEHYLSLMAELEYKLKAGILIEAEPARKAAFEASRKARDKLLTVADRLAPVVAGLDNQFECHKAIQAEIRLVLNELSQAPLGAPAEAVNAG